MCNFASPKPFASHSTIPVRKDAACAIDQTMNKEASKGDIHLLLSPPNPYQRNPSREAAIKIGPILDSGNEAITSIEPGLKKLTAAAEGADQAFEKINNGTGLFNSLLRDETIKNDVKGFIANLRKNGILFYKDNSIEVDIEEKPKRRGPFKPK